MAHRAVPSALALLALIGCEDSAPLPTSDAELSELHAALDAQALLIAELQADRETMADEVLALQYADAWLGEEVVTLSEAVDAFIDSTDLAALGEAVAENEHAIATLDAAHDDFITAAWVDLQGFADASLVSINSVHIAAVAADYLTTSALLGYATEGWVSDQDFAASTELSALTTTVSDSTSEITALDDRVGDIEGDYLLSSDLSDLAAEADLVALDGRVGDIEGDYLTTSALLGYATEGWVSDQGYVEALADYVSVDTTAHTVAFAGVNVFVQSGSGYTDDNTTGALGDASGAITGLGNLIIGYDESVGPDDKMGAHNLIVGFGHSYSDFGGLISGYNNVMDAPAGAVLGGQSNAVSSDFAVVVGGYSGAADAPYSVVTGGYYNDATSDYSVVTGGHYNEASGDYSVVSGGSYNAASGSKSTVSGGSYNEAAASDSAVSGGRGGVTAHIYSTIGGGMGETTASIYDFVY